MVCNKGFGPGGKKGTAVFTCGVSHEAENGVGFHGEICEPLGCGYPPEIEKGGYQCTRGDSALGDVCSTICDPLYIGG